MVSRIARDRAVARYLALRPVVRARMRTAVPAELRSRFTSLTRHQLEALAAIPEAGLPMRELAAMLVVTPATACALADKLVGHGLVQRRQDAADRRVVRVVRTRSGAKLVELYKEAQQRHAVAIFSRLRDEQIAAFLDVLETLAAYDETAASDRRPRAVASR